jgi:hypothetical protein
MTKSFDDPCFFWIPESPDSSTNTQLIAGSCRGTVRPSPYLGLKEALLLLAEFGHFFN